VATFEYRAVNKQGNATSGTVDAENKRLASEKLIKQGYRPLIVKIQKKGFDPNNIRIPGFTDRVKTKDLVIFTRQLATMINAGVPLVRSLATLQQQTENITFKEAIRGVTKDIEGGSSFGDALAKYPKIFSSIYVNMIRAGEAGGILDEILKKLATQQEKDASMKRKLKSAMTYPTILMGIMIIAFFAMTIFILPSIGDMIKGLAGEDVELPIYTLALLGLSDFMTSYWWLILLIFVGSVVAFKRYTGTPSGLYNYHKLLLKIPIIKDVITKVAIARFARIFASLMSSGVAVVESINVTADAIGNKVIERELKDASKAVINGRQLSEPLADSKIFPPIVSQMLAVGEETGQTDTVLIKVADFYEEEVDVTIDALSSVIEPIMILLIGAMVGLLAASVYGPIADLSKNIQ